VITRIAGHRSAHRAFRQSMDVNLTVPFEAVEFATLEWVAWFNHRRLLEPIGNVPPAEAEARYYAQAEAQALVA
jgi:transposase InsO family protein